MSDLPEAEWGCMTNVRFLMNGAPEPQVFSIAEAPPLKWLRALDEMPDVGELIVLRDEKDQYLGKKIYHYWFGTVIDDDKSELYPIKVVDENEFHWTIWPHMEWISVEPVDNSDIFK